jgi:putative ABC transport system permease protein
MTRALLREQVIVALRSIRGNALRTGLTIGIIGLGITALISMTTATSSLEANITQQFASLGTQSFTIRQATSGGMNRGRRVVQSDPIRFREVQAFLEMDHPDWVTSYSLFGSGSAVLSRADEQTDPNIQVLGIDNNYLKISGFEVAQGRDVNADDVSNARAVAVCGPELIEQLFQPWEDPIGQDIAVGSTRYTVVGVLAARGQAFGMSQDKQCLIPATAARRQFSDEGRSYSITCRVHDLDQIDAAADRALGDFRTIRRDAPGAPNSFVIEQSNALVGTLEEAITGITLAATAIGIITLFGAGIGLMNIMLVSVAERTREIGVRKSLGATPKAIRAQFIIEVLVIGQLGGLAGIVLGIGVGNVVANYLETPFVIPWNWMALGVVLSLVTSLISGYYPAKKAAELDPIVALGRE